VSLNTFAVQGRKLPAVWKRVIRSFDDAPGQLDSAPTDRTTINQGAGQH